jgi:hypothetical protein
MTDARGPRVGEGERGEVVPFRGEGFLGRGLDLELGQIVSPGAFSIFISPLLLFFFCFS